MSKVNKPKFKIHSKLGTKLTDHPKLTSQKLTAKKWQSLYSSNRRPRKETEYGSLLQAKQKLKAFYGCSSDKQFTNLISFVIIGLAAYHLVVSKIVNLD